MNLTGKKMTFHRKENTYFHPKRVLFLLALIFSLVFLARAFDSGQIKRPYDPTVTPTRTNKSFVLEAETQFESGNLPAAIKAYQEAIALNPNDVNLYSQLARLQVYSSASLSTDDQKRARLKEAMDTINTGVKVADDDSDVHAVKSFVLDWNANTTLVGADEAKNLLTSAEQEAVRAIALDPGNNLAKAFYAEVLMDSMKYSQSELQINEALNGDPNLMDLHRIMGQLWEIKGNYLKAIEEYKKATDIMPNLTFLYINIGLNYRVLAANDVTSPYYNDSLEWFAKAATINTNLGITDPIPYLAIAKTYSQMGEFYIASLNGQKALVMEPNNPDVYGQLGIIEYKGKNYEGSRIALKCAILGCSAKDSCDARQCDDENNPAIVIDGMGLSNSTVVYYYTYGSVLAGLSKPQENNCAEALEIFKQVREKYSDQESIMSIVKDGEGVCANIALKTKLLATQAALGTAVANGTPMPATATPTNTPVPVRPTIPAGTPGN